MLKIILFLLLFSVPAQADSLSRLTSPFSVLKRGTLYDNPLANPHSPEFSLSFDSQEHIQAKLGDGIGIISYDTREHSWQLGLEASAWLTLGYKDGSFPLLTEDFFLSIPFAYRYRQATFAVKWNHISAHLGDGASEIPRAKGLSAKPITYSRDFLSFHVAREITNKYMRGRVYLHLGSAYKIHPEELAGDFLGGGMESILKVGWVCPYIALEVNLNRDTYSIDSSAHVGVQLERRLPGSLEARVAVVGYHGKDRRGQMLGRKLSTIGLGVFIR